VVVCNNFIFYFEKMATKSPKPAGGAPQQSQGGAAAKACYTCGQTGAHRSLPHAHTPPTKPAATLFALLCAALDVLAKLHA